MTIKFTYAKVTGSSEFPMDMLRYDSAWPRYEAEIHNFWADHHDRRSIEIVTFVKGGRRKPSMNDFTDTRWASFGWRIELVS